MKTVFVTGASRGIGKSIALELGNNFKVVVGFSNSEDMAVEVVEEINNSGGDALSIQLNIGDKNSVDKAFTEIENKYSHVDILINNAGITRDNILPRMKEDEWNDVIQTNLTGNFYTSQRAIKKMIKNKWGRIIFISSVVGLSGNQGQANYAASKAGLIGLSKSISKEVGSRNITSNVIAPGYIETDMTSFIDDENRENIIEQLSIKRMGMPEDISNMVSFLCKDESEYITGQVIPIDGGLTT
ncbi:MAG: 3-oxoacyl-[acyl-carrier-protein] reductase [Candidatus Actinomarina sp.]|jgi:3-oxoacyl-[acyl-carrier protein] reductase|tara:strand:- start:2608 stop:3336 length:729 start_codon:yes stop_codon:yes gene_type:complete